MTKICLISDTHFGVRNDQSAFLQHMHWFFQHVFFPKLEKERIRTIVHLGDLVDRRKYINYHTLNRMKSMFLDPIKEKAFDMHIITGNHDHYWRNTSSINSLDELLADYQSVMTIYRDPDWVKIGPRTCLMLPWITNENRETSMSMVNSLGQHMLTFGHLELAGFVMNPGSVAEHGDPSEPFKKASATYSGHYHAKSSQDSIHYLGAPFQFTWGDYGDPRGFHILDLNTLELEFIENPYSMFRQFVYDGDLPHPEIEHVMDCYVKVIVKNKKSQADFEAFLKKIDVKSPLDIKIVETVNLVVDQSDFTGAESTVDIIKSYIDQVDIPAKPQLEALMMKLYQDALLAE